ncbi:MAG TPA: MipA/OmpV family protein [Sphingomicrobium sp.]|nr:MipA/OmpV family protein [Sphingomicrobium sp.]
MRHLLVAAAFLVPAWSAAAAQDGSDTRVRVGLGGQLRPLFIGSDRTKLEPLFHINTARDGHEFKFSAPDDSPGIAVVSDDGFSFGPAANIEGRRNQSDVRAPVGNVARTFEIGAFAQYEAGDSFRVRAEILKGVNGSKGLVGTIGADKIWRSGDRYVFSIGPRVLFSDGRFERAYFGVTPAASLASGLPVYRPSSGVYGVALASGLSYQLGGGPWGLFGYARYERLVGDAAKSPIIREFGSRNQLSGGIGLNYTFTFHL